MPAATTGRDAVLVAARPTGAQPDSVVALFADEQSPGATLSWERQYELAGLYSRLYGELSALFAPALAHQLDLPIAAAVVLTREAMVPLSYFYFDRLIRLDLLLARREAGDHWRVAAAPPLRFPARAEEFQALANTSAALAQVALERQARIWNLDAIEVEFPELQKLSQPQHFSLVNRNFNPSTLAQKIRRVGMLAYRKMTGPRKPIPVLSMGYSAIALMNEGFYESYLVGIQGRLRLEDGVASPSARAILRESLLASSNPVASFLESASLSCSAAQRVRALEDFVDFATEAFPSSLLERGSENVARGVELLRPFAPRPLIVGERGGLESATLIAATKILGVEAINFQHGGHIGYLADQTSTLEIEVHLCDRFITWGWTRPPVYPPYPPKPLIGLPNPWLSGRAREWRQLKRASRHEDRKEYDFLLFSNRIHRFPTAPSGAYQFTTDYLEAHGKALIDLVREVSLRHQRILHKPYNNATAKLMACVLEKMEREGGTSYRCVERLDKGLDMELLAQCRVVLWDQPGTGFLECLAGRIPTMCYWRRLYNREDPIAADSIAELESVGIIHGSPQSLLAESQKLKDGGVEAWMNDPRRARAVAAFSRSYGWADDNWAQAWEKFLST